VDEDWKYVAMVLDRLCLWIFSVSCFTGTCWILLQAPALYDSREAIDLQYRPIPNITLN
jgi:nicotinic acetylcholine receptor, invertebrate